MSDLRSKLIRLAYEKPQLRAALLPVLKDASDESEEDVGKTAAGDAEYELSAPENAGTAKGAAAWLVFTRNYILGESEASSPERAKLIKIAQKNFSYAKFLFRGKKALVAFYSDASNQVGNLIDVVVD